MNGKGLLIGLAALALVAVGVFVGWRVLNSGTIDADTLDAVTAGAIIATAVGTLGLAFATYSLAAETRDVVNVSQQEVQSAQEGLELSRRQAEVAQAALDSQT